jgi:hypothetical protein
MIITDPSQIQLMQLLTLRQMLKLELLGMRHSSGVSALTRLRQMGLVTSRTRKAAMVELNAVIEEMKS